MRQKISHSTCAAKSAGRRNYAIYSVNCEYHTIIITSMLLRRIMVVITLALCGVMLVSCGAGAGAVHPSKGSDLALHTAASAGDVAGIKRLVANGANVNQDAGRILAGGATGGTPLHIAARYNQEAAIYTLVHLGAIVNWRTNDWPSWGYTPLHTAAYYGSADAAVALVKSGADLNIHSKENYDDRCPTLGRDGCTPLKLAESERGRNDAIAIFLRNAARQHDQESAQKARELIRRSKEPPPPLESAFADCAAWSWEVLGDGAKPAEHLELTNSCLLMKKKYELHKKTK